MAKKIKHNIHGAPVKIGQIVKVNQEFTDDTAEESWAGTTGIVIYLCYDGCGQTYPTDPLIAIRNQAGECEQFWIEEITPL